MQKSVNLEKFQFSMIASVQSYIKTEISMQIDANCNYEKLPGTKSIKLQN